MRTFRSGTIYTPLLGFLRLSIRKVRLRKLSEKFNDAYRTFHRPPQQSFARMLLSCLPRRVHHAFEMERRHIVQSAATGSRSCEWD